MEKLRKHFLFLAFVFILCDIPEITFNLFVIYISLDLYVLSHSLMRLCFFHMSGKAADSRFPETRS